MRRLLLLGEILSVHLDLLVPLAWKKSSLSATYLGSVGPAIILGRGPGVGKDGLFLDNDMGCPIQGENGLGVDGGLLPLNDHLVVLDDDDLPALVLVLVVNGGSGFGVVGLLLHNDLRRSMHGGVLLAVDKPLVLETRPQFLDGSLITF